MRGYIFDTNIFNSILDNKIHIGLLPDKKCFVTHIQYDEIQATTNKTRQSELVNVFLSVPKQEIPTEAFVLDISRLDQAKLGSGSLYGKLLERLNQLNKRKQNNSMDILIAETAITNNLTLVTHDRDLYFVVTEFNGFACNLWHVIKSE